MTTFIRRHTDCAAFAVILGPAKKVPIIRTKRGFWKFPGGKSKRELIPHVPGGIRKEAPLEALFREVKEETGLDVSGYPVYQFAYENRGNHDFYLFLIETDTFSGLHAQSAEGEEVRLFTLDEIETNYDFLGSHLRTLHEGLARLKERGKLLSATPDN